MQPSPTTNLYGAPPTCPPSLVAPTLPVSFLTIAMLPQPRSGVAALSSIPGRDAVVQSQRPPADDRASVSVHQPRGMPTPTAAGPRRIASRLLLRASLRTSPGLCTSTLSPRVSQLPPSPRHLIVNLLCSSMLRTLHCPQSLFTLLLRSPTMPRLFTTP